MKTFYTLLFIGISLFVSSTALFADAITFKAQANNPPIQYIENPRWGNDLLVSNTEPFGKHSGVYRLSNSTIYVSVPDTNIQSGAAIVILTSNNNGASWSIAATLSPASVISKTKMIRSAFDSIYCYYLSGTFVYCWNVLNNRVTSVRNGSYRDFDVGSSSTGSMYVMLDSLGTNNLVRYGSPDGGVTWGSRGLISSGAAHPRIYFSPFGDTLTLNYYGPVLADTATSIIRNVRYRETSPGVLAATGSFTDVAVSSAQKKEFATVRYGNTVWFVYTSEVGGNVDIKCKVSVNAGLSFTDSTTIGSVPNSNEYWFDAKHHNRGAGGVDVIYYSSADVTRGIIAQMNYSSASSASPSSFNNSVCFANHTPVTSARGYIPALIEYYNAEGDAGAVWVGDDAGSSKLYFDRLLASSTLNLTVNLEAYSPTQDTVIASIRNVTSPYNTIESAKTYLSPGGTASINYFNAINGVSYFIVVNHRNSIETWSKPGGEAFTGGTLSYNFTTSASQAFGSNMVLVSGKYSFYSGDVNQDGSVDITDDQMIDNDLFNFVSGYVSTDLNGDDNVDLTDAAFADNNTFNFVGVIRP